MVMGLFLVSTGICGSRINRVRKTPSILSQMSVLLELPPSSAVTLGEGGSLLMMYIMLLVFIVVC